MRNWNIAIVAIILFAAAVFGYRWYSQNEQEKMALLATNSAAVISVSFKQTKILTVYKAEGKLIAKTGDTNAVGIGSGQTTRAPFVVDYQLDLQKLSEDSYRWDERTRTMFVTIPNVVAGRPNIDWQRAQVQQSGFWVSREAGQRLQKRAALQLVNGATNEANKPANLEAARRSAIETVSDLTTAPLKAAGMSNVRIVARFASDRTADSRWDESRALREVLAEAAR